MFQNISDNDIAENKINLLLKELFRPHNFIVYILTFLVSMVEIKNEVLPFGLAIVGACLGSTIPVFMVYLVSLISTLIFHSGSGFSDYFYISIVFFTLIILFRPKIQTDDRNEVFKVGTRLFFSSFICYIVKSFTEEAVAHNIFVGFVISALTYIFYKIFVNGIVVIRDFKEKKAFTIEEIIASLIIFAIAISVFKDVKIFELSVTNILTMFLIIWLGWKNGMIVGGTAGLAIGTSLSLLGELNSFQILVFSICGILSGIFSKLGKFGVIGGFAIGNAVLVYLNNGSHELILCFREIFIATLGLLFVPSKFKIKIEELFPKETLLENSGEHRLSYYEEIKEKINAVAQTISDMNNNFFIKNSEYSESLTKEIYIDNFLEQIENYSSNIFYEDLINNNNLIADFFDCLKKEDIITEKDMLDIFKKYNNYILLRDQKLRDDLREVIKVSNKVYHEIELNSVKQKIKEEESLKLENELKNVTEMIENIPKEDKNIDDLNKKEKEIKALFKGKMYPLKNVKVTICNNGKYIVRIELDSQNNEFKEKEKISNIENLLSKSLGTKVTFQRDRKNLEKNEYFQIYSSEDKFALQVGSSKISKDGDGKVSGDSNLQMRLNDGKYLLAISDGMGSGEKAKKASKFVINSLNTLLSKGFEKEETIKLINSELNFNKESDMYSSLDMSILDLFQGNLVVSKNGACNTYIKTKKGVDVLRGSSLPVGIVEDVGLNIEEHELNEGDIILMCSDGLLEASEDDKKDWIEEFLNEINITNVQKIADLITNEAVDKSFGLPKDDITVIVAKIIKKK